MSADPRLVKERFRGALIGLAVGDAMGATTEFLSPHEIRMRYGRVRDILGGGWLRLQAGETTDDTAMVLAVASGLIEAPDDPIPAIGKHFLQWAATSPKDIGNIIRTTFSFYSGDWFEAARQTHRQLGQSAGNGSLMRCLPVALAYRDWDTIAKVTRAQSLMTHYDPEAAEACVLYNRIAWQVLSGRPLREAVADEVRGSTWESALEAPECPPDGYVRHTLRWVLWLTHNLPNFRSVVEEAVNAGGDTDTVAAIAGGLSGLAYGCSAIPDSWKNQLLNRQSIDTAAFQLFHLYTTSTITGARPSPT